MDKKFVRIDDLVQQKLHNETNNVRVNDAWAKMEHLLDDNDRVGGGWFPNSYLLPLLLLLIVGISGTAYLLNNKTLQTEQKSSVIAHNTSHQTKNYVEKSNLTDASTSAPATEVLETQKDGAEIANHIQQKVVNSNTKDGFVAKTPRNSKKYIQVANDGTAHDISEDKLIADASKSTPKTENNKKLVDQLKNEIKKGNIVINNENKVVKKVETPFKEISIKQSTAKEIDQEGEIVGIKTINDTQYTRDMIKIDFIPLVQKEIAVLQTLDLSKTLASNSAPTIKIEQLSFSEYTAKEVASLSKMSANNKSSSFSVNKKYNSSVTYSEQSVLTAINNFFNQSKMFYASLQIGTLASAKYWDNMGFQFGGFMHYWLGDKTSVDLGVKYAHRPINYIFNDEEKIYDVQPGVPVAGGYLYNYQESITQNKYLINNAHSFIIPLTVSYDISNRFTAVAGAEAFFNLPSDYRKETLIINKTGQKLSNDLESSGLINTQFQAEAKDLDNRMAVGYVLGLNYNINNNWSIFTRWNQPLLSNTTNSISKAIYQNTAGRPFIELGINFNMGKNKRVIYLLDKENR